MPELRGGPEAALQLLADALRAHHNTPPGKRAAPTNGWTAADELELIMRRWRALLVGGKMGEITVGKRKADACKKHSQRLNKYLHERTSRLESSRTSGMSPPHSSVPTPCVLQ